MALDKLEDDRTLEEAPPESVLWSLHQDLHIVLECDRPLAGSTRHCLRDVDEVVVGRGPSRRLSRTREGEVSLLVLEVPDSRMSSRHARLRRVDGHWMLDDSDSRNGTYLNGRRVASAHLVDGAAFELGHTHFLFRSYPLPSALADGLPDRSQADSKTGLGTVSHEHEARLGGLVEAARAGTPILLLGEAGSGKDTLARALHVEARRAPLVEVRCMLLPRGPDAGPLDRHVIETLTHDFERAAGGTVFLDEIEGLSPAVQIALAQLLKSARQAGVHIIASARSSDPKVAMPQISADLFSELAGFAVRLPPLRDRREDIGLFVSQILSRTSAVEPERIRVNPAMARSLFFHDWPYNLSELDGCIRSAVALSKDGLVSWSPVAPLGLRTSVPPEESTNPALPRPASDRVVERLPDPEAEFVQNVRRALKSHLSLPSLQKNGLIHAQMVIEATKGSLDATVAAPALRDLFLSAIESMRNASPRGEKQSRVLQLTFVKPVSTQQEAADQLAMAFGTYRRYVTSALAELTNILWFNESSARVRHERAVAEASAERTPRDSASIRLS